MSTMDKRGRIDPDAGVVVSCFGRKGSGKSLMALYLFRSYPYDRVVIDVAKDDGPERPEDPTIVQIQGTVTDGQLPEDWPEHHRQYDDHMHPQPMTLRYAPDTGSPTHREDMDHVVGLAFDHGHCMLLVHEVGILVPANRTLPNTRRVLHHSRHQNLSVIWCGPRPADIDPLVAAQSDLVFCFDMPNSDDRDRVAKNINWDRKAFSEAMDALRQHEYLRYDAKIPKPEPGEEDLRLMHYPPLPADVVAATETWAFPKGRPTAAGRRSG
jgi:hypothetical protein